MITATFRKLKSLFLHGLFTIFPIAATIVVVHFCYNIVARWMAPLKKLAPISLRYVPGVEFVMVVTAIILVGALLRIFILSPVVTRLERLIKKIPLIRIIYSSSKILVDFFNVPSATTAEKNVVLIEFPRKGCYNLAFLLDSADQNFGPLLPPNESGFVKVFMPSSPNPTTGFFFIIPRNEIIHTSISFEEAIKTVVSCGIHSPDSLIEHTTPHHEK
jgi:uncharacterized membrane protein